MLDGLFLNIQLGPDFLLESPVATSRRISSSRRDRSASGSGSPTGLPRIATSKRPANPGET